MTWQEGTSMTKKKSGKTYATVKSIKPRPKAIPWHSNPRPKLPKIFRQKKPRFMLFWGFFLLALFQAAGGFFLAALSMDFVRNPTADANARAEVFRYYGTFSRTFLTMFATITLPNFCLQSCFLFTSCQVLLYVYK